jgi:hypothetical protein
VASAPPQTENLPNQQATKVSAYQGLPARFDLPSGSRFTSFSQELLRVDREQAVRVVALSMELAKWIGFVIALAMIFVLFRDRHALQEALRARTQVAPAPEVAPT